MALLDFLSIRKAVTGAAEQVRALRAEIEKLRRERDQITTAPAARADVQAEFLRYARARADDFTAAVQRAAAAVAAPATFAKLAAAPSPVRDGNLFGLAGRDDGQRSLDGLLAALAPGMIEALIARAVDGAEWPAEPGLPRAERAAAVAKLDGRIADLLRQERELVAEARAAGLLLPEG